MIKQFMAFVVLFTLSAGGFAGETSDPPISRKQFTLIGGTADCLDALADRIDALRKRLRSQLREQIENDQPTQPPATPPSSDPLKRNPAAEPHYVLMVTASWCGPCQQVKGYMKELAKEGFNIDDYSRGVVRDVFYVDFDKLKPNEQKEFYRLKYDVTSLPTFVKIGGGSSPAEIDRRTGFMSKEQFVEWYFKR